MAPPPPRIHQADELASLSSMVKVMYEAMVGSGLLKTSSECMEIESLGAKRPAEQQLHRGPLNRGTAPFILSGATNQELML